MTTLLQQRDLARQRRGGQVYEETRRRLKALADELAEDATIATRALVGTLVALRKR